MLVLLWVKCLVRCTRDQSMPKENVLRGVIRVTEYFHGAEFRVIDIFEFICKSSIGESDCYGCEAHHSAEFAANLGILKLQ